MVTFASRPSPAETTVLPALAVAKSKSILGLLPSMANRHGLIAGATGTGKTVTLQSLAERFSAIGVPVFMADVKGDLAGMAAAGGSNPKIEARVKELKRSASDCSVTVFPVPVAPAMRPWRFAIDGRSPKTDFDFATASAGSTVVSSGEGREPNVTITHYRSPHESATHETPMAGHSKWANIQHRKGRQDAKRGKIFTRLIKEITVAARMGGGDPAMNPRLRLAMDKAYENNMPKDNIERAIKRGTGGLDGVNYEEIRYEGYGVNGAAVIVDTLTDNRIRTVAEVRHAFAKYGGNMGANGSVAFLFKHCGQLLFAPGTDEDKLMEAALEAGAEDVIAHDDGSLEVITGPYEMSAVKAALEKAGFKAELAEVTMKPSNETELSGEEAAGMQKLIDALESLDDVQDVYTTASLG